MATMTAREIRELRGLTEILKDCSANEENLALIRKAADALESTRRQQRQARKVLRIMK